MLCAATGASSIGCGSSQSSTFTAVLTRATSLSTRGANLRFTKASRFQRSVCSSAAPLFHNIAAWLLQRDNVPLSPDPGPPLTLQAT